MCSARVTTLVALQVAAWSFAFIGIAPPLQAWGSEDRVATLARTDLRAPAACRRSMHSGVAVVVCDRRRGSLPSLSSRTRRAHRIPRTRPARALAGDPLAPGEQVHLHRRSRRSPRTQLIAVAATGPTLGYARYRLPAGSHFSATLRVFGRGGRPRLVLGVRGRHRAPQVERWLTPEVPAPPAPAPAPAPTPAPVPTPALSSGPTTFYECGTVAPVDASDATDFDRLWHVERSGPGWTGGDGAISVPLDDGRIAWLFGDSFIGGVLPDGRRSPDWHMVRNTVVVQDGRCLTTAVGGPAEAPTALLQPVAPDEWYWPEQATVDGPLLHVIALRVVRTGPTGWDFGIVGVDVVDLDLTSFTVKVRRSLTTDGAVLWGSSILEIAGATYIYGVENTPLDARVFLARLSGPGLAGGWQFFSGDPELPWSPDPHDAAPLPATPPDEDDPPIPLTGVPSAITVVDAPPGVMLVSQAPVFGTAVAVRRAPAPQGPFSAPEVIATAAPPPVPGAFTYGARLHPELAADGLQLLSWNVNSTGDLMADATLYRPRFVGLTWPPATPEGSDVSPRAASPAGISEFERRERR